MMYSKKSPPLKTAFKTYMQLSYFSSDLDSICVEMHGLRISLILKRMFTIIDASFCEQTWPYNLKKPVCYWKWICDAMPDVYICWKSLSRYLKYALYVITFRHQSFNFYLMHRTKMTVTSLTQNNLSLWQQFFKMSLFKNGMDLQIYIYIYI